jgi:tight adherence protein C
VGAYAAEASATSILASVGVSLAATLSVLYLVVGLARLRMGRQVGDRLVRLGLRDTRGRFSTDLGGRRATGSARALQTLGMRLAARSADDGLLVLRQDLVRAGISDRLSAEQFLALRVVALVACAVGVGALAGLVGLFVPIGVATGALVGYALPLVLLARLMRRRRRAIERALPTVIDMLAVSLEAGLSFDGAVTFLVDRTDNELVVELRRCLGDLWLGRSRREALLALVERTQSEDVRQFVGAVIQADELGTGLVRALRAQARALRSARRTRAEEQARKAPVKLLFPLILCIMPVLLMIIIGPAVLEVLTLFGGQ